MEEKCFLKLFRCALKFSLFFSYVHANFANDHNALATEARKKKATPKRINDVHDFFSFDEGGNLQGKPFSNLLEFFFS